MHNLKYWVKLYTTTIITLTCFVCAYHQTYSQENAGILKDRDGNIYTIKIFSDNKIWMTSNLMIQVPGVCCYADNAENCKKYGRLYVWKAALEGCRLLGDGWRLPTNEEWQQMAAQFGGVNGNSKDSGRAAFQTLMYDRSIGFNIVLGGNREVNDTSKFARLDAHGFYWTATETNTETAWFYNLAKAPACSTGTATARN